MKDIKGYEGLYAVTEEGQVWSYRRQIFLKPKHTKNGYLQVGLHNGGEVKTAYIHRLVSEAYLPNPNNLPEVNHKNEDKTCNCVSNLEWCDKKYNTNYGNRNQKISKKNRKEIYCIELDKIYGGLIDAEKEIGVSSSCISNCLKGRYKTAGGYHWRYVEDVNKI